MKYKHLISGDIISKKEINELIKIFNENKHHNTIKDLSKNLDLERHILGLLFLQPSLRTAATFKVATIKAGGNYIDFDVSYLKDNEEGLRDTIVAASRIVDSLAIRGPTNLDISQFIEEVEAPIINAMFGKEHFHGALWLLYEIIKRNKDPYNLKIGFYGFSKYSRPALAIIRLFSHLGAEIYEDPIIKELSLDEQEITKIHKKGGSYHLEKIDNFIADVDILFITEGLPIKEGLNHELHKKYNEQYTPINNTHINKMKNEAYFVIGEPRKLSNGKQNAEYELDQHPKNIKIGDGFVMATMLMLYYLQK